MKTLVSYCSDSVFRWCVAVMVVLMVARWKCFSTPDQQLREMRALEKLHVAAGFEIRAEDSGGTSPL